MTKTPHTLNGKFIGAWYVLDDGRKLYLAHRTRREIYRKQTGWIFEVSMLEKARAQGVEAIGVVVRLGKKHHFYLTKLEDFFTSPYAFKIWGDSRCLGLPLSRFAVNPGNRSEIISASMNLR